MSAGRGAQRAAPFEAFLRHSEGFPTEGFPNYVRTTFPAGFVTGFLRFLTSGSRTAFLHTPTYTRNSMAPKVFLRLSLPGTYVWLPRAFLRLSCARGAGAWSERRQGSPCVVFLGWYGRAGGTLSRSAVVAAHLPHTFRRCGVSRAAFALRRLR